MNFLKGFIACDTNGDGSIGRLCALLLTITACVVALRFPPTMASAAVVGALVSGGAVAIINRNSDAAPKA